MTGQEAVDAVRRLERLARAAAHRKPVDTMATDAGQSTHADAPGARPGVRDSRPATAAWDGRWRRS
ncbi:MAG: hypothetical protein MZV64_72950 [Ignavibacteriales bacterium]|nr:hypothetical protein [Ignavibacteriales bacterium]